MENEIETNFCWLKMEKDKFVDETVFFFLFFFFHFFYGGKNKIFILILNLQSYFLKNNFQLYQD